VKTVSFLERLAVCCFVVFLITGCSGSSEKQIIEDNGMIYPSVTSIDGSLTQQCRAEVIRREGNSAAYLNTYFLVGTDGTETVQSQSESSAPCS
jgi:hypothetical protein